VVFSQGLLSPASLGPKPTLQQVQRLVDQIQQVAKNVVPISVITNPGQIAGLRVPVGTKPSGALIDGRVYLFVDNLKSTGDAYVTLFHEFFRLGLQKVIPAENYAPLVWSAAPRLKTGLAAQASRSSQSTVTLTSVKPVTGRPAKKAHVNKTAHNVNKSEQDTAKTKGLNRCNAAFVAEYPKDRCTRARCLLKKPEICAEFLPSRTREMMTNADIAQKLRTASHAPRAGTVNNLFRRVPTAVLPVATDHVDRHALVLLVTEPTGLLGTPVCKQSVSRKKSRLRKNKAQSKPG
jgi:hypothetical protein